MQSLLEQIIIFTVMPLPSRQFIVIPTGYPQRGGRKGFSPRVAPSLSGCTRGFGWHGGGGGEHSGRGILEDAWEERSSGIGTVSGIRDKNSFFFVSSVFCMKTHEFESYFKLTDNRTCLIPLR